jgi:hypothetical protein
MPEVEDPLQIQLSEDPDVIAATDQVIEQQREEMLRSVPELRLELARARTKGSDRTGHYAVDGLDGQSSVLRRHYARYLFRRERSRLITLDTDGLVIDAIRHTDTSSETPEHRDGESVLLPEFERYAVILEGLGSELLRVNAPNAAEAEWLRLPEEHEAPSGLRTGPARDSEIERWIVSRDDREQMVGVAAGKPNDTDTDAVTFAQLPHGARTLTLGDHRAHGPQGLPAILPQGDTAPMRGLLVGHALDPAAPSLIPARDDGGLRLTAVAGTSKVEQRPIRARNKEETSTAPCADTADDPEPESVSLVRYDEERASGLRAGLTRDGAASVILARINGELSVWLGDGRALDLKADPGIRLAADRERRFALLVGRAHDSDGEAGIHGQDEEALRLTAVDGGKAAHPHEKAILAGGDDEWMTSLLAGTGVGRIHERVILAQEDEWLRPSLVAG